MKTKIDPYNVKIESTRVDPYLVCQLFGITDFPIAEAIKKLLRLGRKHKNKRKDVEEAVLSLQRWLEIQPATVQRSATLIQSQPIEVEICGHCQLRIPSVDFERHMKWHEECKKGY